MPLNSVIDADGKLESGHNSGNLVAEGTYDQCMRINENPDNSEAIRGQYVLGWWDGPVSMFSLQMIIF